MIDMIVELKHEPKKPKVVVGDVFMSEGNIYMITSYVDGFAGDTFYRTVNLRAAKLSKFSKDIETLMNDYPNAKRLEQTKAAEFAEE